MQRLLPLLMLGCAVEPPPPPPVAPDAGLLADALVSIQPGQVLDLVDLARSLVPADEQPATSCPAPTVTDEGQVRWAGRCVMADGTALWGELAWLEADGITWVAAENFRVWRGGSLVLAIDGAIELQEQGDLLMMDAAASFCRDDGCATGPTIVDLTYTVFPLSDYPDAYDVTVSGAVGTGDAPISVEGTWSVDALACPTEPASGTIAVRQSEHHVLSVDGATDCDGCGSWVVQGVQVPAWCGAELAAPH